MSNSLSYYSLKLDLFSKDGVHLQQASGFVVEAANQHDLITNRHIISDRLYYWLSYRLGAGWNAQIKCSILANGFDCI